MRLRHSELVASRALAVAFGCAMALLCTAHVAWAAGTLVSGVSLSVERAPGAEDCPDASGLASSLQALGTNTPAPSAPLEIQVTFSRRNDEYSAVLVSRGRSAGERELHAVGQTCAGIASSVAVTLAVLLDLRPQDSAQRAQEPARAPQVPPHERLRHPTLTLSASPGAAFGLVGPRWSTTASSSLQVHRLAWQVAVGALWGLPRSVERGAGHVAAELIAGRAAACRLIPYADQAALGACASLFGGVISGAAHGYSLNGSEARAWGAASVSALWRVRLFRGLALQTELQALVPFRRQEFSIDGLGVVYRSSPAAAWLQIGPELTIW